MRAIQVTEQFANLTESNEYFEAMSEQDGFMGGRLTQVNFDNKNSYKVQVFFECDQTLEYGLNLDDNTRVVYIIESQKLALGIGNPCDTLNLQCPIEAKPLTPVKPKFYCFNQKKDLVIALEADSITEVQQVVEFQNSTLHVTDWHFVMFISNASKLDEATAVYIQANPIPARSPSFFDYDADKAKEMRRYNRIADGLEQCDRYRERQTKRRKRANRIKAS